MLKHLELNIIGEASGDWIRKIQDLIALNPFFEMGLQQDVTSILNNLKLNPDRLPVFLLCYGQNEQIQKWNILQKFPVFFLSQETSNDISHYDNYLMLGQDHHKMESQILRHCLQYCMEIKKNNQDHCQKASEVIARAAHDLKTPVVAIQGFCSLMRYQGQSDQKTWRNSIDRIEYNARTIDHLITRYMTQYEILNDRISVKRSFVDLRKFVESELSFDICRIRAKGLVFENLVDDSVPEFLYFDSFLLQQVLRNLLDNSLYHTPIGFIKTKFFYDHCSATLKIYVEDSGVGIPFDKQERLFEALWRGDGPAAVGNSFVPKNIGLGLNNSQKIVRLLGGDIQLVQSVPDEGSEFMVYFQASTMDCTYELKSFSP